MPDKNWKPWNDINHCSAKHHPDITEKARYDSKPSKSAGWGCNMSASGLSNVLYVNNPAGMKEDPHSRHDRLQMIASWSDIKTQELTRRPTDARFCNTLFIPLPNELSVEEDVNIGAEICGKLFGQEYPYSFSIHLKESERKEATPTGKAAAYSVTNNHIHIMFSERNLTTGKKGSGGGKHGKECRPFKQKDGLRKMINAALGESLTRRGYKIGANTGEDKKVRIPRGEYQLNQKQNEAEIAVSEAEKAVEEKRAERDALSRDLEAMEREFEAQEKAPRQRPVGPQIQRHGIDLNAMEKGMNDLKDKVTKDRDQQKDQSRQRSQSPREQELDRTDRTERNDRDGMDI